MDAMDGKFSARFVDHDGRFARLERASLLHTWMLGILVVVLVIPQLQV